MLKMIQPRRPNQPELSWAGRMGSIELVLMADEAEEKISLAASTAEDISEVMAADESVEHGRTSRRQLVPGHERVTVADQCGVLLVKGKKGKSPTGRILFFSSASSSAKALHCSATVLPLA